MDMKFTLPDDLASFIQFLKEKDIIYEQDTSDHKIKILIAPAAALEDDHLGVYSEQTIKSGTLLGKYIGKRVLKGVPTCAKYLVESDNDWGIDASKNCNWTRFINHSGYASNVYMEKEENQSFSIYASKLIKKGDQILLDYGNSYHFNNTCYYLHPTDNWKKSSDCYNEQINAYGDETITLDENTAKDLGYEKDTHLLVTKLFSLIYSKPQSGQLMKLKQLVSSAEKSHINTPSYAVTKQNIEGEIEWAFCEHKKQALITPLMLACYLGQKETVNYLIKEGGDITKRTLHRGHNAFFFTLLGKGNRSHKQDILTILIKKLKKEEDKSNYVAEHEIQNALYVPDSSKKHLFDYIIDRKESSLIDGEAGKEIVKMFMKSSKKELYDKMSDNIKEKLINHVDFLKKTTVPATPYYEKKYLDPLKLSDEKQEELLDKFLKSMGKTKDIEREYDNINGKHKYKAATLIFCKALELGKKNYIEWVWDKIEKLGKQKSVLKANKHYAIKCATNNNTSLKWVLSKVEYFLTYDEKYYMLNDVCAHAASWNDTKSLCVLLKTVDNDIVCSERIIILYEAIAHTLDWHGKRYNEQYWDGSVALQYLLKKIDKFEEKIIKKSLDRELLKKFNNIVKKTAPLTLKKTA